MPSNPPLTERRLRLLLQAAELDLEEGLEVCQLPPATLIALLTELLERRKQPWSPAVYEGRHRVDAAALSAKASHLCAGCSHGAADHPTSGPCQRVASGDLRAWRCDCKHFVPPSELDRCRLCGRTRECHQLVGKGAIPACTGFLTEGEYHAHQRELRTAESTKDKP